MIGGAVRRVPPDPVDMEQTVRSPRRAAGIGVAPPLAIEQRRIQQARPGSAFRIVAVVKPHPAAGAAVAIGVNETSLVIVEKPWISHPVLQSSRHFRRFQRGDVTGFRGAEINQRIRMQIAGNMKMPVRINRHGHVIVRVPADRGRQSLVNPVRGAKLPRGDRHAPPLVVICHILSLRRRKKTEADPEIRHHLVDLDSLLNFVTRGGLFLFRRPVCCPNRPGIHSRIRGRTDGKQ